MPADSILVAIGVCIMFLLFAFVLAWADHTTSQWLRERQAERQSAVKKSDAGRKAA
jgi:hypothetical protein